MSTKTKFDIGRKELAKEIKTIVENLGNNDDAGGSLQDFPKSFDITISKDSVKVNAPTDGFSNKEEFKQTFESSISALHQAMDSAGKTVLAFKELTKGTDVKVDHALFPNFVPNEED